ncbi:MAG: class I SAM-dependent methyltransferase [candidate division KSB1 bacterium]|nr:class I SAM-dependent methyltransferase [candidate division KSB1 bacterium]
MTLNSPLFQGLQQRLAISFSNKRILDIGCGSGMLGAFFNNHQHYTGLDLNQWPSFHILTDDKHHYSRANALHLPIQNAIMDIAICMDSFEHFPDQFMAAREIRRVLKPNGSFILSVPNYANISGFVKYLNEYSGRYEKQTWAPFDFWEPEELEHFMTPGRIKTIFRKAGFRSFQRFGYDKEVVIGLCPWVWHPKMPRKLARLISKLFEPVSSPLVKIWPESSLHTFWKIQ